jgi:fructoselysine and glucoselysine-specific PTS system IID component
LLGLIMVGAMTATTVSFPLNWTIAVGEASVSVVDIFNSIYQDILSVILVLIMMGLIKKGHRPLQLIIGLLIFALLGAMIGIF